MTDGPTGEGPPPGGPPPQPGIVPLRALDAGEIVGGAVRFARRNPVVVLVPGLLAAVVVTAVQAGMQLSGAAAPDPGAGLADALAGSLTTSIPLGLVYLAVYPPVMGILLCGLRPAVLGRRPTLGGTWAATRPRLRTLYGVQLVLTGTGLAVFAVVLGVALPLGRAGGVAAVVATLIGLAAYAALIYVGVLLYPAVAVAAVEGLGVRDALWRSVELVRGSWWRFFGVQLLAMLFVMLLVIVLMIPLTIVGVGVAAGGGGAAAAGVVGGLVGVVAGTVGAVLTGGVLGLLHQDQRIRREHLDADLVREAGFG